MHAHVCDDNKMCTVHTTPTEKEIGACKESLEIDHKPNKFP